MSQEGERSASSPSSGNDRNSNFLETKRTVCGADLQDFDFRFFGDYYVLIKYKGSAQRLRIRKYVTEIGPECFAKCDFLFNVTIEGADLTRLGRMAFYSAGLKSFRIPKSVKEICECCFSSCMSLLEVTFEDGSVLKKIGEQAFQMSGLTSFLVVKSVEEISAMCFLGCKSLTTITIEEGSNLSMIGVYAFEECPISCVSLSEGESERICALFESDTGLSTSHVRITQPETSLSQSLSDSVVDISEYQQVRKIGRGGFGDVFLYSNCDSSIVVKFIESGDERNQELFEREIESLYSLSHPFIVKFVGYGIPSRQTGDRFAVSMEYISGGSLENVVANRPPWFDDTAKMEIICGIALGMAFVHSKGIMHRDLKLANVLIDENHLPRVCDFGSSRLSGTDNTITTSPCVTVAYAAPEVYDDAGYTQQVDVYSFGVMLYEIITGSLAFRDKTQYQLMSHICGGKRAPIPEGVTPFARDLIEKCWHQKPEHRPSFQEVCSLLKDKMHVLFFDSNLDRIIDFRAKYFS